MKRTPVTMDKKPHRNTERGAASVLVIFMLMVLSSLGAFAITSANVGYKLSIRAYEWNAMYYELDALGEEFLWEFDDVLRYAEERAYEYTQSEAQDKNAQNIMQTTYMKYVSEGISSLSWFYPDMKILEEDGEVLTSLIIKSEAEGFTRCHLSISLSVKPPEYEITQDESTLTIARIGGEPLYEIDEWREYQVDEEPAGTGIWNGIIFQ